MERVKRIANKRIPLYGVLAVILLALSVFYFSFTFFAGTEAPNYQVLVPEGDSVQELEYGGWPAMADRDFFGRVKEKFIAEKSDFIEADLSEMKLRVYRGGEVVKEVPILTKGKEGSWWETPAGLYKVESKIKNHFSGFAKVYLPWSMPFQGNFFIHGWPYYEDGTPVSSTYSGGCIRLSTEDAKAVYDLVKPGEPVIVYEKDFAKDQFNYELKPPELTAQSFLAADLKSNAILAEKNPGQKLPIASITKLMTALVAVEYVNIEREVIINEDMITYTSVPRLTPGQKISLYNLLPPLLLESSNEAANAISYFLGPKRFVSLMNEKAKSIGMSDTVFVDPSGKGAGNVSSSGDLFALSKYLYNNRSFILKITSGRMDNSAYGPLVFKNLQNFNLFHEDPEFVGGKVGQTQAAKETLLAIFDLKVKGEVRPVVFITLSSEDYTLDGEKILGWIRGLYEH